MRADGDSCLQNGIEQVGWKTTTGHIRNESSLWYVETYEVCWGELGSVAMFSNISPSSAMQDSGVGAMPSCICSRPEDIAILLVENEIQWRAWGAVWWKEDGERCSGRQLGWGHHMMSQRLDRIGTPQWHAFQGLSIYDFRYEESHAFYIREVLLEVIPLSIHSHNGYIHGDLVSVHQHSHWNKTRSRDNTI